MVRVPTSIFKQNIIGTGKTISDAKEDAEGTMEQHEQEYGKSVYPQGD
jgi:hypothetical protein